MTQAPNGLNRFKAGFPRPRIRVVIDRIPRVTPPASCPKALRPRCPPPPPVRPLKFPPSFLRDGTRPSVCWLEALNAADATFGTIFATACEKVPPFPSGLACAFNERMTDPRRTHGFFSANPGNACLPRTAALKRDGTRPNCPNFCGSADFATALTALPRPEKNPLLSSPVAILLPSSRMKPLQGGVPQPLPAGVNARNRALIR